MAIEVKNVTFTYSKGTPFAKKALDNCSVTINDGDFVAIIGHTGSGKTTLTQLFNGLIFPDKKCGGTVLVDGIEVTKKTAYDIRKKVGYVFQYPEHQLFEETVYKDIAFGLKRFKISPEEENERIKRAVMLTGISEELLERSVYELSGGEKRRVAIAGVIVAEPKYLVLDEPASGLDPAGKEYILDFMQKLNSMGVTIILISHSMDDVAENAKRVIVLNDGKTALDGTVDEVFSRYDELTSYGLDVPEINKLFHRLHKKYPFIEHDVFTLEQAKNELIRLKKEGRIDL